MTHQEFVDMIVDENSQSHLSNDELLKALRTALSAVPEESREVVYRQIWNDDFDFADDPFETVKLPRL